YWSWKERHDPSERFPRGESINQALLRYAEALQRLVARPETVVLLVIHEFGLRHIAGAAGALSLFPRPAPHNAAPYLFGELALRRASDRLEALVHSDRAERLPRMAGLSS
ncbi:MAG: histidine phosphatase family protein, partial [Solirubrobacterales bacterium]|nr:histidine phosphatase family protein [Solirubrobacterales bacterium]